MRPESVGRDIRGTKGSCPKQTLPALRPHAVKLRTRSSVRRVWGPLTFLATVQPAQCSLCAAFVGQPHNELLGLCEMEEAKAALAKQAPAQGRRKAATSHPAALKAKRVGLSAEQMDLGEVWSHVVRGGRVKTSAPSPTPKPTPNQSLRHLSCPK